MTATLFAFLIGLAQADDPKPSCWDSVVQQDLNRCAYEEFVASDADLNAQWRLTLAAVRDDDRNISKDDQRPRGEIMLRDAQRAWIGFRDAHCTVQSYRARGGSMEPMLLESCRTELTKARTKQLKEWANYEQ